MKAGFEKACMSAHKRTVGCKEADCPKVQFITRGRDSKLYVKGKIMHIESGDYD